ncbi:hypothetical protein LTR70_003671 [Exophiala xenobiotica]|uniref:Uncharacterized protein n=1 Tax=Lithohypha guttulata TaxID=1690604 RepID=A0ABR0KI97_9EURO|nr:hypothetical protein LTR24_002368 [Lithohypha guttulata]KAK5322723.1 hypothetical protein LTR70_003671 [Exophiala xenobiotica]
MTSNPDFDPYCPSGGSWYACGNGTNFAGCCGEYPCTESGCSAGLLYDASFDASKYGTFSDQQCSDGQATSGCPSDSLAAIYLSANPSEANQFDPQPPLAGSSSTFSPLSTASSTLTTSSSSAPSPTATGSAAAASTAAALRGDHHSTPVGAIAGGAVGGFALLCAIVFIVWRVKYHSKRSTKRHSELSGLHDSPAGDQNGTQNSNAQEKWTTAGVVQMQSSYQGRRPPIYPTEMVHQC